MSDLINLYKNLDLLTESKKDEVLNVITLFSGMGAPELALDKLGVKYKIVIASDIDDEAARVYKQLHGNKLANGDDSFIPNVYDVISSKKDMSESVDLLIGGFPCQAFSSSGKQYGVFSRKVKLVNSSKTFILHLKKHLTNINGNIATTINNDENDLLPESLPENTEVEILPESDGKLSFETLKIAQTFKPKVIILENVAAFGNATIDDESVPEEFNNLNEANEYRPGNALRGKSGIAQLNNPKNPKKGGYLRALGNIFNKIGYSFYPMYLDPTSYSNSINRRPRIYIVGIRNDIEIGINPNKLEYFDDKMATNFGLNSQKSEKDYEKLLDNSLNFIMKSKYSDGFMSKNPKELVKNLIAKFGINRFVNISEKVFTKLINDKKIDIRKIQINGFNYDNNTIDAELSTPEIQGLINNVYNSYLPILIDVSTKSDTIEYLSDIITRGVSKYFDQSSVYKVFNNNQSKVKPLEQMELDLEEIVESINNPKIDIKAINKFKEIILKKILVQFLMTIYNKKSLNYIPTILKASILPGQLVGNKGTSSSASYFILRNKTGEFAWGYLHPAILMKLMGMFTSKSEGDDEIYQKLAATKLANGQPISLNGIIRRIGNSMSVEVLEKLFKSLISMKAFR